MESLVVHIENKEQAKAIKAFMKALKIKFEKTEDTIPPHIMAGIENSTRQFENGETISLEEFKEKHFRKKRA